MTETTLQVRVPSPLLRYGIDQQELERRVSEWLVFSLFTENHISSGKAAKLLNLSRAAFLNLLRLRGIAYLNFTDEELQDEFEAVNKLEVQAEK